ncbi:MAG TPA: heme-binding protein [Planctomycetaceae bacterium]|nr:heme-binding protein [Planctomycetaceae bacterium]
MQSRYFAALFGFTVSLLIGPQTAVVAQTLESRLKQQSPQSLAKQALETGDAKRGAVLFHQRFMSCVLCHVEREGERGGTLGPRLVALDEKPAAEKIVEAILTPSKTLRKGFESYVLVTVDGRTINGILRNRTAQFVEMAVLDKGGQVERFAVEDIDELFASKQSIMPAGLVNQLASPQQFLDLVRYVNDVVQGGPVVAQQLKPSAALLAPVLPEYESRVDHRGLLADLDNAAFARGKEIYQRLCINCHGTHDRPGSLPTSLKFASDKFKNGHDPYTMYQTLTRGFGMMAPQTWMVPQQKYDVIHYIRSAYLQRFNSSQFVDLSESYLAGLPIGDTRGPAPVKYEPWVTMDYGPTMTNTFEVGGKGENFAYKGIAVRLDKGAGGVSRGRSWMVFDHDTMRMAAAWTGSGYIDWNGIHFNGRHNIHPRVVGDVHASIPTGPGWADPETGSFDDPRIEGRDGRRYGPLPRQWAHYKGLYHYDQRAIIEYTVGRVAVLESPQSYGDVERPIFARVLNVGARQVPLTMRVVRRRGAFSQVALSDGTKIAVLSSVEEKASSKEQAAGPVKFDGKRFVEIVEGQVFDMTGRDFTIVARIKTRKDGVIFAKTKPDSPWLADGKALFVRGGRLCYDIGWVGAVSSKRRVADGKWHDVAAVFDSRKGELQLYIDGELDARGELQPKSAVDGHVIRIGYSTDNFPTDPHWRGQIQEVRLYQSALEKPTMATAGKDLVSHWRLVASAGKVANLVKSKPAGQFVEGSGAAGTAALSDGALVAGVTGLPESASFKLAEDGDLRLTIPAGDAAEFVVWFVSLPEGQPWRKWMDTATLPQPESLTRYTQGGPPRWGEIETTATIGSGDGPFAIDVLTRPTVNPWQSRVRLTGHDFLPGGDQVVVTAWDGDVWMVSGLSGLSTENKTATLRWRRIASGMFQPLGVKYHKGKIFVTCRDQLAVLEDLNADGEVDHYVSFNNDHQVTDHFHEFAMGLQIDDAGYFYYAKSARHALPALVPHHGTLLRVSPDGKRTDIVAVGFRAANGVCLNPDGTFIVTDQEGHWNPKNRINWVKPGQFYGNMFGYHDITDTSDEAMTAPLCWITNSFDRSPAELLWVDSPAWGPLNGSLLNLSYGYGKVFVVPHEKLENGQVQGGMCELPIPQFPTGVMRGRFHPVDKQLYLSGMFAWAGNQHQPGGFYRLRYTGQPVHLPVGLRAHKNGVSLRFTEPLDAEQAMQIKNYAVKTWSLKRTQSYGSKHYDEKKLKIDRVDVSDGGRAVFLAIEGIEPTWCMEIVYSLKGSGGEEVNGTIHNTIHELGSSH